MPRPLTAFGPLAFALPSPPFRALPPAPLLSTPPSARPSCRSGRRPLCAAATAASTAVAAAATAAAAAAAPAPVSLRHSRALLRHVWDGALLPGAVCIDATCGRGADALQLAARAGSAGLVHALDIQEEAVNSTRARVAAEGKPGFATVVCERRSHESFVGLDGVADGVVSVVVYNLGWLPGDGVDRAVVTTEESTVRSLEEARRVLRVGGVVTVTGYLSQEGGVEEVAAVERWCSRLDVKEWSVAKVAYPNRDSAPMIFVCERLR